MTLRTSALALLLSVAPVGCRHATKQDDSRADTAKSTSSGVAIAAAPDELDANTYGWSLGQRYTYDLEITSRVKLESNGSLFDFSLTGHLAIVPVEVNVQKVELQLDFAEAKFASRLPGTQRQFDEVTPHLSRPYFVTLVGGLVTESHFPPGIHPLVGGVFRTVGTSLQFARSKRRSASTYATTEFDTTGQYSARYDADSSPNSWHKRKQRYTSVLLSKDQPKPPVDIVPQVVTSQQDYQLSEDGRPLVVRILDEIALNGAQVPVQAHTQVLLKATAVGAHPRAAADWKKVHASAIRVIASEPYDSQVPDSAFDNAKIQKMTFAQIATQLEQFATVDRTSKDPTKAQDNAETQDEAKLFTALGAIFRRQPETIAEATSRIASKSAVSGALVDGLGSADTSAAQDALIELISSPNRDENTRVRAVFALSRTEHPSLRAIQALNALVGDKELGTQAMYGLGTYCRLLREAGDNKMSTKIGTLLTASLAAATSELQLVERLRAVANSGHVPALPILQSYLIDPREQVRVDAVRALRLMDSRDADTALAERLTEDKSKYVQLAAIEAMVERKPTEALVDVVQRASVADDPHVRHRAVSLMIRWLPIRSELRTHIQLVAQNDSEEKIRNLAAGAL